jgi:hypothetical protein
MTCRKTKYITLDHKYIGFILIIKALIICFSSSSFFVQKQQVSHHHHRLTYPPQFLGLLEVLHVHQYATPDAILMNS